MSITVLGFKNIIKNKIGPFEKGVVASGDKFILTNFNKGQFVESVDCFVQFNIFNPYFKYKNKSIPNSYKFILNSKKPFLVCEEGAIRSLSNYKRWGWTSYKNKIGKFNNNNVSSDRWDKIQQLTNIRFLNWNSPGDNILIMGQLERDSALIEMYDAGYKTFDEYIIKQIKIIRHYTDRPIVIRSHPLGVKRFYELEEDLNNQYKNIKVSKNYNSETKLNGGKGLEEDLTRSYCVITYNSNSAVEAVEKGIPIFTLNSTSAAYEIGHKDLSQIENLNYDVDTSAWCNKIAYTIWNEDEVADGSMWRHLRNIDG